MRSKEYIQSRVDEIQQYCNTKYPTDIMDILLERSGIITTYMSEIPGLIDSAKALKDNKLTTIIEKQPDLKVTMIRFMVSKETSLVESCENLFSMVKHTLSVLQSQMAANRIERHLNNLKNEPK